MCTFETVKTKSPPSRIIKFKKQKIRSVHKDMEKSEHLCIAGGNVKIVQPLRKTIWWLLKKLNIELSYDPAILLLGIHPKKLKAGI